jgi:hypothetical protein
MPPKPQMQREQNLQARPEESDAQTPLPQREQQWIPELRWKAPNRQPELQEEPQWVEHALLAFLAVMFGIVALAALLNSVPVADPKLPPTPPPAIKTSIPSTIRTLSPRDATRIPTPQSTEPERDEEEPEQPDDTETPTVSPSVTSRSRP